jgi:hypothetical protein
MRRWSCSKFIQGDSFDTRPKKMRISQRIFIRFWINFCNIFTYEYIYNFININYIYKILNWIMTSLWDIRIFLDLVPKESPCIMLNKSVYCGMRLTDNVRYKGSQDMCVCVCMYYVCMSTTCHDIRRHSELQNNSLEITVILNVCIKGTPRCISIS